MEKTALQVSGISKKFRADFWKKAVTVLNNISFDVPNNSICGLIGPNGAGKTTTIKIILDFIRMDAGHVKIFGEDSRIKSTRQNVGYLPEAAYYYDFLKPVEFLNFYAGLFQIPRSERGDRIESLLKLVGLSDKKDQRLRSFSKGMLQRIGIAQALINDPQLVIFDEPMSGLDPIGRREVRDIILKLKDNGKTVLFSTHILPDVENLCDHVVMLVKGDLKASGKVGDLIQPTIQSYDVEIENPRNMELPANWKSNVEVKNFQNRTVLRFTKTNDIDQKAILDWTQKNNISMVSFIPHKQSLEDILMQNIGGESHG
jgi:ABC-2 type transport system ATP-binding protein